MAGEREDAAVVLAAEEGGAAVDGELAVFGAELAQAGLDRALVAAVAGGEPDGDAVERRREFVPGFRLGAEREYQLGLGAGEGRGGEDGTMGGVGVVEAFGLDGERAGGRPAGGVAKTDADAEGARCQIGVDLHVVEPDGGGGDEVDAAEDAVPVGLRAVVELVGLALHRPAGCAVVDHDSQRVPARGGATGEIVGLGRAVEALFADGGAVEPDLGVLRALEAELDAFAGPVGGHVDLAVVPDRAVETADTRERARVGVGVERALAARLGGAGSSMVSA
jgi:hypothetical protein